MPFTGAWPKIDYFYTPVVLADLDNDSISEIIYTSRRGYIGVFAPDGSDFNGWPVNISLPPSVNILPVFWTYTALYPPSVGDLDNDGAVEILTSYFTEGALSRSCIYAYKINGTLMKEYPICPDMSEVYIIPDDHLTIGDLDKDGKVDILIRRSNYALRAYYRDLTQFYSFTNEGSITKGFPKISPIHHQDRPTYAIGDLDGDGDNELVSVMLFNDYYRENKKHYMQKGGLYVYDTPGDSNLNEWPQYQHNAQHTGLYSKPKVTLPIDKQPPAVNAEVNTTSPKVNDVINFSGKITDNVALLSANITYNISGVLTKINFMISGTSASIHNITKLTCAETCVINFTMYATDTSNNMKQNSTLIRIGAVADTTPPVVNTTFNITSPAINDVINFSGKITDGVGLISANITYNMSGSITKADYTLSGTSASIHNVTVITCSGCVINFTMYATDTSNNMKQNSTLIAIYTTLPTTTTTTTLPTTTTTTTLPTTTTTLPPTESKERPKSGFVKNNTKSFEGQIILRVDKQVGQEWINYKLIADKRIQLGSSIIKLDINQIWAENGYFTPTEPGLYRIYAEIINIQLNNRPYGVTYKDIWEFRVE